ncbi:MarR family winged helix-turn-helix transcriptional regulator [Methanobrevibacter sp.]|uniref:MarR family winged helix-turn-helix transcriptional regulator n=1 Tax=Methanobrevibacter sp. TaxID=66852 RepID=UPI00386830DA
MKFERVFESYTYNRFGELLYILHKNNRKYLNDSLAEHDLNLLQAMCLLTIEQKNDITQKELTEILYLTKSGITKALNKLQKEGFVIKEKSVNDNRKFILKLTEKGEDIIPILNAINDEWERKIGLTDLDDEFIESLKTVTYKSIELNLEKE